ncbi:hypothetical protein Fmac_028893 [Flemingia macrophylla]|uniref:Uncharacterized protein n=1 Tax=Flemingia macrophylla TaxID=520843 RepID=A0ABD1L8T8_9FABA
MMSDYKVEIINDGMQEFFVESHRPKDSKFVHPFVSFYLFILFVYFSSYGGVLLGTIFLSPLNFFSLLIVFLWLNSMWGVWIKGQHVILTPELSLLCPLWGWT